MDRCVEEDGEFYAVQDQFPNVILPLREDHYVGPQVHSYMCQSWSNKGFEHRKTMCVCVFLLKQWEGEPELTCKVFLFVAQFAFD